MVRSRSHAERGSTCVGKVCGLIVGALLPAAALAQGPVPATAEPLREAPDSAVGQYRFAFETLDVDGDGFISRAEAQANPALADEFTSLDTLHRGRLDRSQLQGWLLP